MFPVFCKQSIITLFLCLSIVFSFRLNLFHNINSQIKHKQSNKLSRNIALSHHNNEEIEVFASQEDYLSFVKKQCKLPQGFSVGTTRFPFQPIELAKTFYMNMTIILLDEPSSSYGAIFTSNQFPGGPILVGKDRIHNKHKLQAIVVNNKISNVCPGGIQDRGQGDSELICKAVASTFGLDSVKAVFPSSTGVIGWRLPTEAMIKTIVRLLLVLLLAIMYCKPIVSIVIML